MSHTMLQLVKLLFQKLLQKLMNASSLNYSPHGRFPIQSEFSGIPLEDLEQATSYERVKILRVLVWSLTVMATDTN